ncbi:hypothetical protein GO621_03050 [Mucilaginibacter sp. HMF7410]|uniref:Uncharacterized protein n=1 Tax=Mucilaginibacter arboris TaxID=2682090 RepID=A0A7K1STW5_9SPHI|nr:hypothetical protein [Mucilaginibacter arboris]
MYLHPSFTAEKSQAAKVVSTVQPYVYACVFSSLCIIVGVIWDISWHTSIGRDGLFAPPHMVIYVGAVVSGVFSGYQVLRTSFFSPAEEKSQAVKFWGIFHGSLGALFCIWGAIAMLTSAPFDDWWHNTYGLDVTILSPPHTLLALGAIMIQFGTLVAVASSTNHLNINDSAKIHHWLFAIAAGVLVAGFFTVLSDYLSKHQMHRALFYQISSVIFPLFLIMVTRASNMKWAATATAAVYMSILLLMLWILPIFHAYPRLGPVLNHIDHYQAFNFPLLLVFPALAIDWIFYKFPNKKGWVKAAYSAILFLAVFFVVQWYFGTFLLTSTVARNSFFGGSSWYFGSDPDYAFRYAFRPEQVDSGFSLIKGLLIAAVFAVISAFVGYKWGSWMKKVQR